MFADIAGFTALMENDEELAMAYRERMKQKLEAEVLLHNGKIMKWMGDGVLCSFYSAIESVRASLALQKTMQQEPIIPVRIGIHQADVIFEGSDVHGDGVNIASRLESLAIPGSIFISAKVFDDIKNQKEIQTISLGKYLLKNVKEPVEIYALSNPGLKVPLHKRLEGKGIKYVSNKISIGKKALLIRLGLVALVLAIAGYVLIPPIVKKQNARNIIIPELQEMVDDNFSLFIPTKAFDLAKEAERYIPKDSALIKLWPVIARNATFETTPDGANVYWKDYNDVKGEWQLIGQTPFKDVRIPRGFLRLKIEKSGFRTVYSPTVTKLKLDSNDSYPVDMVKVIGSEARMNIVGLEQHGGKYVSDFLMDKYEVTNKDYKRFVDAGGYRDKKYWDYPFESGKSELTWEEAMKLFTDKTGRQGPANWEVGTYPDGKDSHPVTGVSWYEAMAFAKFSGKKLPTVYHWSLVANTYNTWGIIPKSNFNGIGTVPVGSMDGISNWGVYDIAGNVREWCFNESDIKGQRFILGGGWNDPTYAYNDGYIQSVLDRSLSNGFRCMKNLPGDSTIEKLAGKVELAFRDYSVEKPVNDETFNIFLRQYTYDHSPLHPDARVVADTGLWKIEKIDIDAAYNKERLTVYLFLPKNFGPPFQTVVFFPGSGVIYNRQFNYGPSTTNAFDFILKSGRAVLYPVLKGTFERGDELNSDLQNETKFYKDHVISWVQDVNRALDYLETRSDIVHSKFGYYGYSWGSAMGGNVSANEPRLKVAIYHVGGLMMQKTLPEVDPLNFFPRVKIPVLMLNGKNDTFFPVETSQKPMFKLIGTPEKDKKIIIYEGGHLVPKSELMKESLSWLDKYLGPVK
jgi:dienelactone hydrolase